MAARGGSRPILADGVNSTAVSTSIVFETKHLKEKSLFSIMGAPFVMSHRMAEFCLEENFNATHFVRVVRATAT